MHENLGDTNLLRNISKVIKEAVLDCWRIERIPYDQFGSAQYLRIYGWGWLGPLGAGVAVAGAIALVSGVHIAEGRLVGAIAIGFVSMWVGIFLNGYCERKQMVLVEANIIDLQINHKGVVG